MQWISLKPKSGFHTSVGMSALHTYQRYSTVHCASVHIKQPENR